MQTTTLVAASLSLLAFFAHAWIGDKEFCELKPNQSSKKKLTETWIQTRAGWHWVSVDLLLCSAVLFAIALTDLLLAEKQLLLLLSIYFLATGIAWLITVVISKRKDIHLITFSQWVFCLLQSGLCFYGWLI